MLARLQTNWSAHHLSNHFLTKEGLNTTPDETWEIIHGALGLRAMYQNAGVMLEMANFAAQNSDSVDPELLRALRSNALQIRGAALKALIQHTFTQADENIRIDAFRVASMYTGMVARMTNLLQENASILMPEFVAAM